MRMSKELIRSKLSPWSVVRAYFGIVSRVMPGLARRQAERIFTLPPRYTGRTMQSVDARRETVVSGGHSLAVWEAGPLVAPAVLLAHGWGGRGLQMESLVVPLLAAGRRVVWFDQPGHGESGYGAVGLPDFVHALHALASTHGPFEAVIGHSLGAAAAGIALRRGLHVERVVFVSSPASLTEYTYKFARVLGITPSTREAMRQRLELRYAMSFADIDRIDELAQLHLPALFVHDSADTEIPFENSLRLHARMPDARLIKTYGLGHRRILRDCSVVRTIVDFVRGDVKDLPAELPRLPSPAAIY
jgi:pimeloyl-ACP methyl ester carboxylesterase